MKTALIALFALISLPVLAADLIDISGDWQAFKEVGGDGKRVCFAGSHPSKSAGKYKKRGEPFLLVTHWPADKVFGEVRFDAGYTLKKGSAVSVSDGKDTVKMTRIDGESVWADKASDDAQLVRMIRNAKQVVVTGISSRGTQTTDTFSLKGSSAALKAIDRVCKAK